MRRVPGKIARAALAAAAAMVLAAASKPPATLKDAYQGDFYIGAAINAEQIAGFDPRDDALIETHFNSISPENALKWTSVHPQPEIYDFRLADLYVSFGESRHMYIVGHNLVWHRQMPAWVFRDDKGNLLDRDALLERMHEHIQAVVGRYKGKIQSWDVVSETLNDDGSLRQSMWLKIVGPDYIEKAFEFAHEADPQALLTYNDYDLENDAKRRGAIDLVKKLKAEGVPIDCVRLQNHDSLSWPSAAQEDATISAFAALGVKVAISELDVSVLPSVGHDSNADLSSTADLSLNENAASQTGSDPRIDASIDSKIEPRVYAELNPYPSGLPAPVQQELAQRYSDLFRIFARHRDVILRITFWGVTDADSWLNYHPMQGRTDYPLLFDRAGQPKPALEAVLRAAAPAGSRR
jgi:endo-1,4-beta-xylanase